MPGHAHARHLAKKMPCFRRPDRQPKNRRSTHPRPGPVQPPSKPTLELYAANFVAGQKQFNILTDKHLQQTAGRD